MRIAIVTTLSVVAIAAVVAVGYAYSGFYDVSASQPENGALGWLLTTTRQHSIDRRAEAIRVPPLDDPKLVQEGFQHYREMCTGCHLAPGMDSSEIREGLNPQPPILAQAVPHSSPARLFWVIKHGVKMTGMPAWGASHSDEMIWAMVAFLEQLPAMTPAQYRAMDKQFPAGPDEDSPPAEHGTH